MKINQLKIPLNLFYKVGIFCFIIIALGNSYSLITNWSFIPIGNKISSIFGIIFNIALVLFFNYLLSQSKSITTVRDDLPSEKELDDIISNLENKH